MLNLEKNKYSEFSREIYVFKILETSYAIYCFETLIKFLAKVIRRADKVYYVDSFAKYKNSKQFDGRKKLFYILNDNGIISKEEMQYLKMLSEHRNTGVHEIDKIIGTCIDYDFNIAKKMKECRDDIYRRLVERLGVEVVPKLIVTENEEKMLSELENRSIWLNKEIKKIEILEKQLYLF